MNDKEFLKKLSHSDEKAFESLFRKYFHALHQYAIFYVDNSQLAEDIVQDIFVKIWDERKILNVHTSLKSYLFRCVHNNCIQYLRHFTVIKKHEANQKAKLEEARSMNRLYFESGINKLFEKEIGSLVKEAIEGLPDKTREIYLMSRDNQLKNSEIAKKINLTEKSVEYHIGKALEILRKYLKDYLPFLL